MKVFNIGDRVRAIDDEIGDSHPFGSEFTVAFVQNYGDGDVFVGSSDDDHPAWYSYHFELVENVINAAGFKVGDDVRIINNDYPSCFSLGAIHAVVSLEPHGVKLRSGKDTPRDWFFLNREVEHAAKPVAVAPVDRRYQTGDVVRILHTDYPERFPVGSVHVVDEAFDHIAGVSFYCNGNEYYFYRSEVELCEPAVEAGNFELAESEPEAEKKSLIMSYNGVTIALDPSVAFSRGFAEAMLNVVYQ